MTTTQVLGIDACADGWIGVVLHDQTVTAHFSTYVETLVANLLTEGPLAVVAVDMPLGLADIGPRQPDMLARKVVGPRAASVFPTRSEPRSRHPPALRPTRSTGA